jgi:class 3 adenylate cyclase
MCSVTPSLGWINAAALIVAVALLSGSAAAVSSYLSITEASLLSGGLTDCPTPDDADCSGGLASALAHVRNRTAAPFLERHFIVCEFDRQAPFVQMHPLGWGINTRVFDFFGLPVMTVRPSLFTTRRDVVPLTNGTVRPLLANVQVTADNGFNVAAEAYHVDASTGIAYIPIANSAQPNSLDSVATAVWATLAARRDPRTMAVVIGYDDLALTADFVSALGSYIAVNDEHGRFSMPDVVLSTREEIVPTIDGNGTTWLSSITVSGSRVSSVRIDYTPLTSVTARQEAQFIRARIDDVSVPRDTSIDPIDASMKDALFYTHQALLKTEADIAGANDPQVGTSTTTMPFVRTGPYRMCMAGECPLGNLWTDSYRNAFGDEIAMTGSGGIRGPGWPAGPVRISDIWGTLPFANTVCRGRLTGVTLWEIFNESMTLAAFEGVSTPTGDRLLQVSGLRVRFSTLLPQNARLVSIEVLNGQTGTYAPLERLRLYSFAADSFFCAAFSPFAALVQRRQFEGEQYEILDLLAQNNLADYLTAVSPHTPDEAGLRLVNDTTATAAEVAANTLVQRQTECDANTRWSPSIYTCVECEAGTEAPAGGSLSCQPLPVEDKTTLIALGIALPLLLILGIVAIIVIAKRQSDLAGNVRDVANAPRDGTIALMFTDVQDSTKLWSTCPMAMSVALDVHHQIIREAIVRHSGYEVKTAGDSFMIAVGDVDRAVRISMDIQRNLLAAPMPRCINAVYAATTEDDLFAIEDDPDDMSSPSKGDIWHGLRVRIGFSSGEPAVTFDEVTKGYDYYGPPVNVAARTEAVSRGGQVVGTEDCLKLASTMDDVVKRDLGRFDMKGVPDPVACVEVAPSELAEARAAFFIASEKDANDNNFMNDESGSTMVESEPGDDEETVRDHAFFVAAMLRAIPTSSRSRMTEQISKAWRIQFKDTPLDDVTYALAKRVSKAVARERRRVEREAGSKQGGQMSMRNMAAPKVPFNGAGSFNPPPEEEDSGNALSNSMRHGQSFARRYAPGSSGRKDSGGGSPVEVHTPQAEG